jgi:hypothetical protein
LKPFWLISKPFSDPKGAVPNGGLLDMAQNIPFCHPNVFIILKKPHACEPDIKTGYGQSVKGLHTE